MDDIVESGKPPTSPKPPRLNEPYDAVVLERRKSLLQHVAALALVAIAVSTSIIAWETHQERVFNKAIYCGFNSGSELDSETEQLADQLDC